MKVKFVAICAISLITVFSVAFLYTQENHNSEPINTEIDVSEHTNPETDVAKVIRDLANGYLISTRYDWNVWSKKTEAIGCQFIDMGNIQDFLQSIQEDNPLFIFLDETARVAWYRYSYNAYVILRY